MLWSCGKVSNRTLLECSIICPLSLCVVEHLCISMGWTGKPGKAKVQGYFQVSCSISTGYFQVSCRQCSAIESQELLGLEPLTELLCSEVRPLLQNYSKKS